MTALVQSQTGPTNDAATFGGVGVPSSGADTITMLAGATLTVPEGVETTCGAITFPSGGSPRTTLQINGRLNLAGTLTMNTQCKLNIGPNGILDLAGNNVQGAGSSEYNFVGTAGNLASIISTGSRGRFLSPGNGCVPTMDYVSISGLDDSVFGRCHGAAVPAGSVKNFLITDCGNLDFDETNVSTDSGFEFEDGTFAAPYKSGCFYPSVYNTVATTNRSRRFRRIVWDCDGSLNAKVWARAQNTTITDCVMRGVQILDGGNAGMTITNCFQTSTSTAEGLLMQSGLTNSTHSDCYLYYAGGNHVIGSLSGQHRADRNIYDSRNGTVGLNWYLYNNPPNTYDTQIRNGLWLGWGIPLTYTGVGDPKIDFSNNTSLVDNQGQTGSGLYFTWMLLTEQVGLFSGASTREFYNNLHYDPDSTVGSQEVAIDLLSATADQVTYCDYNVGYSATAGELTPPVKYASNVSMTAGLGTNDFSANPQFVDPARNLATWDAALGGPGTEANAIAELKKLNGYGGTWNPDYNVADLVSWVRAGYVPRNQALQGTGRASADIGALDVSATGEITVSDPTLDEINLVGGSVSVAWETINVPGTVEIYLSTDDGSTYPVTLASAETNDLAYSFTALAAHVSATAKVKIADSADANVYGESDTFVIATTNPGSSTNTDEWALLRQLAIDAGMDLVAQ